MKPTNSILFAVVVLVLGSLIVLYGFIYFAADVVKGLKLGIPLPHLADAPDLCFIILPTAFALLGLATGFGLLRMKEWARKAMIFLSTVPVLGCALLLLFAPASVFPPRQPNKAPLFGSEFFFGILDYVLVLLTPISLWWLILFTRASVRSEFRGGANAAQQEKSTPWVWIVLGLVFVVTAFFWSLKHHP